MADVTVTLLGSGDAFGSGGRFHTCILVECSEMRFFIDYGASSLIAMRKQGISPAIDTVLVKHLYGDHFAGIPFLILDALFSNRTAPLTIAGPPCIEARVRVAMEVLFPKSSETVQEYPISYIELMPSVSSQVGSLRVVAENVVHPSGAPSYALRVECAGRIILYSGDTEWTDVLLKVADGADLLCGRFILTKDPLSHRL